MIHQHVETIQMKITESAVSKCVHNTMVIDLWQMFLLHVCESIFNEWWARLSTKSITSRHDWMKSSCFLPWRQTFCWWEKMSFWNCNRAQYLNQQIVSLTKKGKTAMCNWWSLSNIYKPMKCPDTNWKTN